MATICVAGTLESQAEVDVHVRQVRAASISGCTQATITPAACSSVGCTITFYRTTTSYGITLSGNSGVHGFTGLTVLPSSVHFDFTNLATNGSLFNDVFIHPAPLGTITGVTSANFFSTSSSVTANTPIAITGAVIARTYITFGVANVGGIKTVTFVEGDNGGTLITQSRPGNGCITVNLCAPK
ncbi:unnamed protein product [Sphagnum balticum]